MSKKKEKVHRDCTFQRFVANCNHAGFSKLSTTSVTTKNVTINFQTKMRRKEILIPLLFHLYTGPKVVFSWCQRENSLTESLIAIVEKHAVILANGLFPCSLKKHNTQIVILTLSIGTTLTRLLHSRGVKIRFITCSHPSSF